VKVKIMDEESQWKSDMYIFVDDMAEVEKKRAKAWFKNGTGDKVIAD